MRSIIPILAVTLFLVSGCASTITGYSRGDFVKEDRTGRVEYLDEETVLTRTSNTSLSVEKVKRYGEVTINYYEKKELVTTKRPRLNPFSLLVYNIPRGIMGSFYLIAGVTGNGRMFWNGLELLILPIPDCSSYGPFSSGSGDGYKMVCVESQSSNLVSGEFETETRHSNITFKRDPVTYGTVSVSMSDVSTAIHTAEYSAHQEEQPPETKKPAKKKKIKKAKKPDTSGESLSIAEKKPSFNLSTQETTSVRNNLLETEIPIQSNGTASFDLARYYDRLPKDGDFTIEFRYQGKILESSLTHADVTRAFAARKPPQLEIARKIETEGGFTGGALSGDDSGAMLIAVTNSDKKGTAWGVNLAVSGATCPGVTYDTLVQVGDLPPGETRKVRVSVSADLNAKACRLALTVQAKEEFGQDSRKVNLSPLTINPLKLPDLHITMVSQNGIAQNDDSVELEATVVNKGIGDAKGVTVRIAELPGGVTASQNQIRVGDMPPNSTQKVSTTLRFAKRFGEQVRSVPVEFTVSDRRPFGIPSVKDYIIDYRYNRPVLKVADIEFFDGNDQGGLSQGNADNLIEQGEWILARVNITNNGTMMAGNVKVQFSSDKPLSRLPIDPSEPLVIASLKIGESRKAEFKFKVPNSLEGDVTFKATAVEESFESMASETRIKRIYEAGAEEGTVELAGIKVPVARAPRTVSSTVINIDEVEATDYRRNDTYALVIGIGRYKHGGKQLPYAAADARVMKDYLTNVGGVPRDNIVLLTDDDATCTGIRSKLTWLAKTAGKNSTIFIYYSGHGTADIKAGGTPYLLPYDGDPANLEDTGISIAELKLKINGFRTKRVMVALEACYAGGSHSVAADGAHPIAIVADDDIQTDAVILSASRANEASWDHPEQRHGIFTCALLKGMRGAAVKDDKEFINVNDLFEYVRKEVPIVANKTWRVEQNPTKGGGDGRGIVVSRSVKGPKL